ncbi:hypothetical protein CLOSTHATH_04255 [Hungatella hathewayi DSM 13479]|uniref:Uncharacterized protein n=1 Tax=Hungatella hathewayi DSM 13479 TaxID=566550 RepID=D3AKW1_9FIRM|nr:hypothetical protein CLOSTHATH_04255 [Hungatella hathewayi DSM 13479]
MRTSYGDFFPSWEERSLSAENFLFPTKKKYAIIIHDNTKAENASITGE